MKRILLFTLSLVLLCLTGCAAAAGAGYNQIDQETAKQMMVVDDGHIVVDVRSQDEYDAGHIPGAILIPNESIGCDSPEDLPDYDQIILVYCRSGRRSKEAAQKLAGMGYTNVYEFGGIIDWTGEVVTTEEEAASKAAVLMDADGYHVSINEDEAKPVSIDAVNALMKVIDTYDVASWDGFSESKSFVLDGEGFWLDFNLTDGTRVHASGDNAFPDHYFAAMGEMGK